MIKYIGLFFEKRLIDKYIYVGEDLGDAVSYSYMGEISGFNRLKKRFIKLQNKIISKGFTPYTLEHLVEAGGWGKDLPPLKKEYNPEAYEIGLNNIRDISYSEKIQKSKNSLLNILLK
jgi:hypothetical protein